MVLVRVEGEGDETVRRGNGVDDYYETRRWLRQSTLFVDMADKITF